MRHERRHLSVPGNTASLSHLSVLNPSGDDQQAIEANEQLTLTDVRVEMLAASGNIGIDIGDAGQLAFNGGAVTMGSSSEGTAIENARRTLTLDGVAVTLDNGAKGAGIEGQLAPMSLSNVTVDMGANATAPGITAGGTGVSLNDVAVTMNGESEPGIALVFAEGAAAHTVTVTMADASSEAAGVEQQFGNATFAGLDVSGAWKGVAFDDQGGEDSLQDSRLISGPSGEAPALEYIGQSESAGLLIQRSVIEATTKATPGTAEIVEGNATFDSSELLGGERGAYFLQSDGKTRTLTLASSTVDAGVLGVRDVGALGVEALAENTASTANVNIEGSIVLEAQRANTGAGDSANYQLNPSSSAVDSVPAGAISLPFGFTPSSTDLAGNPRAVNGHGGCVAVQDRGALELQGHVGGCAPPAPAHPSIQLLASAPVVTLGAITALKLSPADFYAALSGATVSSAKRRYGTAIGYRDSQAGVTTFTVLRAVAGRMHGRSCSKPSAANRKGRSCTLYVSLGSFTHVDTAGADSLHFSGRLKGRRLAKGSYRLQATPLDSAGNGLTVHTEFKIVA